MISDSSARERRATRMVLVLLLVVITMLICAGGAFAAISDYLGKWGTAGSANGQFSYPGSVAVAVNGDIYVADSYNDRIQYFSATGTYKGKWGSTGTANGQFDTPWGVAIAPNGDVYVADANNDRIQYFSATGTYKGKWGSGGTGNGQFDFTFDLAIAPNGDVYVVDYYNHVIQYFGPTGAYKGKWGGWGTGNGQLNYPRGIAVAPNGDIYVADGESDRVQYFGPTGSYKGKWGSPGTGNGQFNLPGGIEVSPDGLVYVADAHNHRIQYFNWYGVYRGKWGTGGSANGQFNAPASVAVAAGGRVYVADAYNGRIQYFRGQTAIQHGAGGVTFQRWVSGKNGSYSGGGYVYSPWAGSALEVQFVGNRITWYGPKQPNYGVADVYFDGVKVGEADCYASQAVKTLETAIFTASTTNDGPHTLRLVPKGTKNPSSTGTAVVVDRFDIDGAAPKAYATRNDEASGTFAGSWVKGYNSAYIGGAYRYSKYPSASYTKTFNGTRVAWIGPKTNGYGRARVYIDGVLQGTVVSQYGTMGWRTKVWESAILPAGNHTLRIVPTGTKDAASKGTVIVIDAIDVR